MKRIIAILFFIMIFTTGCSSQYYEKKIDKLNQEIDDLQQRVWELENEEDEDEWEVEHDDYEYEGRFGETY